MLSLIFPVDQPKQTYRLKRILLGLAFYALCALIVGFNTWCGLYPTFPLVVYTVGFILGSAAFFATIRLGWNLRLNDPSMTAAQIAYSALMNSYILLYAGPFRGVFMLAYVAGIMFGGTHLTTRQLIQLVALPAALFPVVVSLAAHYGQQAINWRVEFVNWVSFCVILSFTSLLVGKMRHLQMRLKASKADLETAMAKLTEMAVRDELTGLYNRRHMLELLESEKRRAGRNGSVYSVCLIDIDHFKRINDTYGHGDGDAVLRTFAEIGQQCIRGANTLARWGGEEFLLLLPQTPARNAEVVVERIRAALEKTSFDSLPAELRVTISAGIAQYRMDRGMKELIERADQALYSAKRDGRNRIVNADRTEEIVN